MKKRALISVSDKTGVVEFARGLTELGYEIISTGGTAKTLTAEGIKNIGISDITGFPECLDGRVKTLHPYVHAGLLARRDLPEHMKTLNDLDINTIDLVAVNLYPFTQTIAKEGVTLEDAIENIDIGGPSMLRSAAKNYLGVAVVVDPADYPSVLESLKNNTDTPALRKMLMYKAYAHTASYDASISQYLWNNVHGGEGGAPLRDSLTLTYNKVQEMRYGENPHQKAAFYSEINAPKGTLPNAEQLWGKALSFNNINDSFGAIELVKEFSEPAAVAVKHAAPCGVAVGTDIYDAYVKAHACDPVSIFGGIVALNRAVDGRLASELLKTFLEVVIAPDFDAETLEIFKAKPNVRLLRLADLDKPSKPYLNYKRVEGGLLVQQSDDLLYEPTEFKVVTQKAPDEEQKKQLLFAFKVVKHTRSNAIVIADGMDAVGIAGGQTNRIWAVSQAIERAGKRCKGAVAASDAFFPFGDCVEAFAKAGITAIIQPGGSVRDQESIDLCDKYGIAMVFTGTRHFKH